MQEKRPDFRLAQAKRLAGVMPDLETCDLRSSEVQRWLGEASAVVEAGDELSDTINFRVAADNLPGALRSRNAHLISATLYRIIARLEMQVAGESGDVFLNPGDLWSAFVKLGEIFASATSDVFLVDPYCDDGVLRDYGPRLRNGTGVRILTTEAKIDALRPAVARWNGTHPDRQVEVRLASRGTVHDRIICVDRQVVWIVTQSLKDLAARAPATVTRFASDLTPEKLQVYENLWSTASPIRP